MAERRYRIGFAQGAKRSLASLAPALQRRIARAVDGFESNPRPRGAALLAGSGDRVWRLRVGDYRILYEIRDDQLLVLVIRIGHRRQVYRIG